MNIILHLQNYLTIKIVWRKYYWWGYLGKKYLQHFMLPTRFYNNNIELVSIQKILTWLHAFLTYMCYNFVYWRALYCCCKTVLEAWNVVNVFSNISSSLIFSPHNFNCEVIQYSAELYSCTNLKSCSLRAFHLLRALGRMTDLKWPYLSCKLLHKTYGSFIVRYSILSA